MVLFTVSVTSSQCQYDKFHLWVLSNDNIFLVHGSFCRDSSEEPRNDGPSDQDPAERFGNLSSSTK